jgi:hypothetical protein
MSLPGVMPPLSGYTETMRNDSFMLNVQETGGSSGVSTTSDRLQTLSDQATPSTQHSSVNNSFTPPNAPSPQNKHQDQQQQQQPQPQQRKYGNLFPDNYSPNMSPTSANPTATSSSSRDYYINNSNTFPPTFSSAGQDPPVEPAGVKNPFAMPAGWNYPTPSAAAREVHQGGLMGGNTNVDPTNMGGGAPGVNQANDGNWDRILSGMGMGWNEWDSGTG